MVLFRFIQSCGYLALLVFFSAGCASETCELDNSFAHCANGLCQPAPPEEGPASAHFPHGAVSTTVLDWSWLDPQRSVIYTPASPTPAKAPVVFFLHGYFDPDPRPFERMLQHIARKGFIVIYPSYGYSLYPQAWSRNARGALERALTVLEREGPVRPDRTRLGFVGHSIGGMLALHLAQEMAKAPTPELPQPRLIVTLDAAGISTLANPFVRIDDLHNIPSSTWLLMILAEETYRIRLQDPKECRIDEDPPKPCNAFSANRIAFQRTPQIPAHQKAALLIPSDRQGELVMRSEHSAVQGYCGRHSKPLDAVDVWGYWKLTVGALTHVLKSDPLDYAFTESAERRSMGVWSNGRPAAAIQSVEACLQDGVCP